MAALAELISENMASDDFDLPPDFREELTVAMPLKLGYPHEWIALNASAALETAEMKPGYAVGA
ncbi:MAG: hypothetical protein ABL866_07750 [Devosia sp.]